MKVLKDPLLKSAISLRVMFDLARSSSSPGGARGHGLLCLGGFKLSSVSHFFSQALMCIPRLLVPNLDKKNGTLGRRYGRLELKGDSSVNILSLCLYR